MLKRPCTRIELNNKDIEEFDRIQKEKQEKQHAQMLQAQTSTPTMDTFDPQSRAKSINERIGLIQYQRLSKNLASPRIGFR